MIGLVKELLYIFSCCSKNSLSLNVFYLSIYLHTPESQKNCFLHLSINIDPIHCNSHHYRSLTIPIQFRPTNVEQ